MRALSVLLPLLLVARGPLPAQTAVPAPPFEAPVVFAGYYSAFHCTGDLNADGLPDVVGWWWADGSTKVIQIEAAFGDGAGSFVNGWSLPWTPGTTGAQPWSMVVGQFDGVGPVDVALSFGTQVRIYASQTSGAPSVWASFTTSIAATSAAAADLDGDGRLDLALAANGVEVWRHSGTGMVLAGVTTQGSDVQVLDFEGDAVDDLATLVPSGIEMLGLRQGAVTSLGMFAHGYSALSSLMLVTGDIDADGDGDAVAFEANGTFVVVRCLAAASFAVEAQATGGPATGLADLDGDGDLDGVCCGGGGPARPVNTSVSTYHVALNDGNGGFAPAWKIRGLGASRLAGAIDVDQDGDLDLVAGRTVLLQREDTFRFDPQPLTGLDAASTGDAADFDQDGDLDVDFKGFGFAANDGDLGFTRDAVALPTAPNGTTFVGPGYRIDFDSDGDLDLVVGHYQGTTFLGMRGLRNLGGGALADAGAATLPQVLWGRSSNQFPHEALTADLDRDGDQDLVTYTGTIAVWLNDGAGFFTKGQSLSGVPARLADMDGDGLLDLVAAGAVVEITYGAGDGTFPEPKLFAGQLLYLDNRRIDLGDVDGDGDLDLITLRSGTPYGVRVDFNSGRIQGWPIAVLGSSNGTAAWVRCFDANGDGWLDVMFPAAVAGPSSELVWNLDQGRFGTLKSVTQVVDALGLADLDADGDLDAFSDTAVRGLRRSGPDRGVAQQYGQGTAGAGGLVPKLGAAGPFRVGSNVQTRLVNAPGGTLASYAFSTSKAQLAGFPFPGMTAYAYPILVAIPLPVSGVPGQAGAGVLQVTYPVPPEAAGLTLFQQMHVLDLTAPSLLTQTNGLAVSYGTL